MKSIRKKLHLINIILFVSVLFTLTSCSIKNTTALVSETSKDSIANYLEPEKIVENIDIVETKKDSIENYIEDKEDFIENYIEDKKDSIENYIEGNKVTNITKKSETSTANDNSSKKNNIEYDVYKKIDFSDFINRNIEGTNEGLIEHIDGGILLSNEPCKVTVKASIKIDRGSGLHENDINDNLAIITELGAIYSEMYYADYDNDFFGKFHEVERACEYFNGRSGKGRIWFSNIGVSLLRGVSNYEVKVVSNSDIEYVGEFFDRESGQTILRVTIKDVYYKISKSTGTVTEWDLDKDFELLNFYGTQAFAMRELEDGYTYIIKPKFTYTVNNEYDARKTKYLSFFYTSNDKTPEFAISIMDERENDINARYSKIGVGMEKTDWRKTGADKYEDFVLGWDKNSHIVIVNEKSGNNIANIKIDYIKEYKYKNCVENETPGYKRYLLATKQNNINRNKETIKNKTREKVTEIAFNASKKKDEEIDDRTIRPVGNYEKKTFEFGDHKVVYTIQLYQCKLIPNLEEIIEKAVSESMNKFFSEYYQFAESDIPNFNSRIQYPIFTTYNSDETRNNYMRITYKDNPRKPSVVLNITIDLSSLKYKFYGSWHNGEDTTTTENTPKHGVVSEDFTSLGYEPIITDWWYKPIENIVNIEEAQVGDYIHFGRYWTQYKESERQNLEWRVLDKINDRLLITTRHVIDCMYGGIYNEDNTWENSEVRSWLNKDFINYAFNDDEKKKIINEEDKAFLLSYDDVNKYFNSDYDRQCKATYFARRNYCWFSIKNGMCGNCEYWLNTPGFDNWNGNTQMYVNSYGEINTSGGNNRGTNTIGIRPAMWIKIN